MLSGAEDGGQGNPTPAPSPFPTQLFPVILRAGSWLKGPVPRQPQSQRGQAQVSARHSITPTSPNHFAWTTCFSLPLAFKHLHKHMILLGALLAGLGALTSVAGLMKMYTYRNQQRLRDRNQWKCLGVVCHGFSRRRKKKKGEGVGVG